MNNTDDILKRILLNMKYDSRKTLKENKQEILLSESKYPAPYDKIYGYQTKSIATQEGQGSCGWLNHCNAGGGTFYLKDNAVFENPIGDGYDYKYWKSDSGDKVWIRSKVSKRTGGKYQAEEPNGFWTNYDWETGLMSNECSTQKCRDAWNKINTFAQYIRTELSREYYRWYGKITGMDKLDKNRFIKYGDEDFKYTYVFALQTKLNQLSSLNGDTKIPEDGKFGSTTLERLQKYFGDVNGITLTKLEAKTGKEIYEGYFDTVGELKSYGWKNVGCYYSTEGNNVYPGVPVCSNRTEHLNQAAFLEIIDINRTMSYFVNRALGCQWITTKPGSNGHYVDNYSATLFQQLVKNKQFIVDKAKSAGNSKEDLENLRKSLVRPYFTYFALEDFYYRESKIFPKTILVNGKPIGATFDSSVWPNGVYNFMLSFYQTPYRGKIDSLLETFKPAIVDTDCADMDKSIGKVVLDASGNITVEKGDANALRHEVLTYLEIGALLLAFIPSPLSPFLFGVSTAAGLADAGVYFAEGDKYMGTMMLCLEIIPGGEFIKVFKKGKNVSKVISEVPELAQYDAKNVIRQGVKNELQDEGQKKLYKAIEKDLKEGLDKTVIDATQKTIKKNIKTGLKTTFTNMGGGLKAFFNVLSICWNAMGMLPQMFIKIGGTMWTADQLYLAVYGRDEDRQKSDIRRLYYILKGNQMLPEEVREKELNDRLISQIEKVEQMIENDPEAINNFISKAINITPQIADLSKWADKVYQTNSDKGKYEESTKPSALPPPSLDSLKSEDKFLFWGMSGDSVNEVKKLISNNWGDVVDKTKIDRTLTNSLFDDDLLDIILDIQKNIIPNNLKGQVPTEELGMIGGTTLSFIEQKYVGKLQPKTVDQYSLNQGNYDFQYFNNRTQQWNTISYDDYQKYKSQNYKVQAIDKTNRELVTNPNAPKYELKKNIFGKVGYKQVK